jgi:hypothetical protein
MFIDRLDRDVNEGKEFDPKKWHWRSLLYEFLAELLVAFQIKSVVREKQRARSTNWKCL